MAGLLEVYLRELRQIRSSGAAVKETSFYPVLANLLNGAESDLKPKVTCILQLANRGAGMPDGGLFTPDQLRTGEDDTPLRGQVPSRGVIEVKGVEDDIDVVAQSKQVRRYLATYGQVLVTTYREFILVERDGDQAKLGERYALAPTAEGF